LAFADGVASLHINQPLSGDESDLVITEPFYLSGERLKELKVSGFHGTVILEKLAAHTPEEMRHIREAFLYCRLYVAHTRLFSQPLSLPRNGPVHIVWPNLYDTGMDPIWNTLPNIIDAIFLSTGGRMPELKAVERTATGLALHFQIDSLELVVLLVPGKSDDLVTVNGAYAAWPNAFNTIRGVWKAAHIDGGYSSWTHTMTVLERIQQARELLQKEE